MSERVILFLFIIFLAISLYSNVSSRLLFVAAISFLFMAMPLMMANYYGAAALLFRYIFFILTVASLRYVFELIKPRKLVRDG